MTRRVAMRQPPMASFPLKLSEDYLRTDNAQTTPVRTR